MGGRKDICGGRIGTTFEARRWLALDPCGFVGITLSFVVHIFAFGVVSCHLIAGSLASTGVYLLLYTPSVLLALSSLYMAWTTNPGCVELGARPLVTVKRAGSSQIDESDNGPSRPAGRRSNRGLSRCPKCGDNYKPNRAHHDSVTGRCIVKFDHFCPWVGNAIGAMNHKFFVLFVGYTMSSCIFALSLIGLRALHCGIPTVSSSSSSTNNNNDNPTGNDGGTLFPQECSGWNTSYASLILLIVCVVFFIFTSCMFVEQIEAIKTNASKIARMKMRVGQAGTELSRVTEEFNEMFGGDSNQVAWHWFLPLPVEFPPGMKKVVMGYEWDETFDAIPYQEPNSNNYNKNGSADVDVELGTATTTSLSSVAQVGGSRIELTATQGRSSNLKTAPLSSSSSSSSLSSSNKNNKEKNSEHDNADDDVLVPAGTKTSGREVPFAGNTTAVIPDRPKLIKRNNSRDHVTTMNSSSREPPQHHLKQGTLT